MKNKNDLTNDGLNSGNVFQNSPRITVNLFNFNSKNKRTAVRTRFIPGNKALSISQVNEVERIISIIGVDRIKTIL
jgi:hypothetical protein